MSRRRRSNGSSIVHQAKTAINMIDRIGESKRDLKKDGSQGIHSLKQKKETFSGAQNYVKWVRNEFGVKSIYELKESHYRAYMSHLERSGRSVGHRQNVETAIRHLQKGMNVWSEQFGREQHTFVPKERVTNWREKEKPTNRSYSNEEYEKILKHLPGHSANAVKLCKELGLRAKEAVRVERRHFEKKDGQWKLKIENGKGITKGGRHREIEVSQSFSRELEKILGDKKDHEKVVPLERDTVRRAVNKACKQARIAQNGRGMHGFRHNFSRTRLNQLLEEKGIAETAPKMMERILSNRDKGRSADYGIVSEKDKALFRELRGAMNTVHSEIGHGENRWDLAAVYMRE